MPTLMWVMLIISLTLALAVLFVQRDRRGEDGLVAWGWSLLLHGATYPAFALRMADFPVTSVLLANALNALALALHCVALARFQHGRAPALPRLLLWGPVLLAAVLAALLLRHNAARALALSLLLVLQSGVLAWQAWAPGLVGPRERGRALLVSGALLLLVISAWRGIAFSLGGDWDNSLMMPTNVQALTYLLASTVLLLNTMGFVLMQKERAELLQREQALRDPLTGIANRRALDAALMREASRAARSGQPLALLMIDIDWFKKVNDSFGHHVGDGVLCGLAQRIGARLRRHDLVTRFGGEEFVVLLPDTGIEGAAAAAEEIRAAVAAEPFVVGEQAIAITVSVGVAAGVPAPHEAAVGKDGKVPGTAVALLVASDEALYRAKQKGRNRVELAG